MDMAMAIEAMATYRGIVRGNTVQLETGVNLLDGTEVVVMPVELVRGSPQAVLAAMDAPPNLKPEDVQEFRQVIEEGRRPASYEDPFKTARNQRKHQK
jgi:hypothetical protein